jgi:hypothetical protein
MVCAKAIKFFNGHGGLIPRIAYLSSNQPQVDKWQYSGIGDANRVFVTLTD